MDEKIIRRDKRLKLMAFLCIALAFTLLSSIVVININCGLIKIISCGYHAGFPVPYAKFNERTIRIEDNRLFVNPTLYYKYKFSPIKNDRRFAKEFLSDGVLIPLFLFDFTLYRFDLVLFIVNYLLWLLPAGFLVGVFF